MLSYVTGGDEGNMPTTREHQRHNVMKSPATKALARFFFFFRGDTVKSEQVTLLQHFLAVVWGRKPLAS